MLLGLTVLHHLCSKQHKGFYLSTIQTQHVCFPFFIFPFLFWRAHSHSTVTFNCSYTILEKAKFIVHVFINRINRTIKRLGGGKGLVSARGKQGSNDVKEWGGWMGVWEKKVEQGRGRKIERVIPNDCRFCCRLALCHSGGSIQRVPLKLILNHIFIINSRTSSQLNSEAPSYISILPHIPALLTSLIFLLINYSFTIIFQEDKGLCEWGWKRCSQGVDGACEEPLGSTGT